MKKFSFNSMAVGASLALALSGVAHAEDSKLFKTEAMKDGYQNKTENMQKCSEGQKDCMMPKKSTEGKCGEGKCGADHKMDKKMDGKTAEGKCGEGKCGS